MFIGNLHCMTMDLRDMTAFEGTNWLAYVHEKGGGGKCHVFTEDLLNSARASRVTRFQVVHEGRILDMGREVGIDIEPLSILNQWVEAGFRGGGDTL